MSPQGWLDDLVAAAVLALAAYSLARLVVSRRQRRPIHVDIDVLHVLMGVAMAGMLAPAVNIVPRGLGEEVFVVTTAWFALRSVRFVLDRGVEGRDEDHVHHLSHYLVHVVMGAAMVYMYARAGTGSGASGGMSMTGATGSAPPSTVLPFLFLVVLVVSALWELDGIGRFAPARVEAREAARALALDGGGVAGGGVAGGVRFGAAPADAGPGPGTPPGRWLAPRLESLSHVVMCVTMAYTLVLLL